MAWDENAIIRKLWVWELGQILEVKWARNSSSALHTSKLHLLWGNPLNMYSQNSCQAELTNVVNSPKMWCPSMGTSCPKWVQMLFFDRTLKLTSHWEDSCCFTWNKTMLIYFNQNLMSFDRSVKIDGVFFQPFVFFIFPLMSLPFCNGAFFRQMLLLSNLTSFLWILKKIKTCNKNLLKCLTVFESQFLNWSPQRDDERTAVPPKTWQIHVEYKKRLLLCNKW